MKTDKELMEEFDTAVKNKFNQIHKDLKGVKNSFEMGAKYGVVYSDKLNKERKIINWFSSENGQPKIGDEIVVYYENTNGKRKKEIITWTFEIASMSQKQKTKFKWILLPEEL